MPFRSSCEIPAADRLFREVLACWSGPNELEATAHGEWKLGLGILPMSLPAAGFVIFGTAVNVLASLLGMVGASV